MYRSCITRSNKQLVSFSKIGKIFTANNWLISVTHQHKRKVVYSNLKNHELPAYTWDFELKFLVSCQLTVLSVTKWVANVYSDVHNAPKRVKFQLCLIWIKNWWTVAPILGRSCWKTWGQKSIRRWVIKVSTLDVKNCNHNWIQGHPVCCR